MNRAKRPSLKSAPGIGQEVVASLPVIRQLYGQMVDITIPVGLDAGVLVVGFLTPDGQTRCRLEFQPQGDSSGTNLQVDAGGAGRGISLLIERVDELPSH